MTADALLTRVAVALHGVTPPDPEGALALHRDAAARVVAALGLMDPFECHARLGVLRCDRKDPHNSGHVYRGDTADDRGTENLEGIIQ